MNYRAKVNTMVFRWLHRFLAVFVLCLPGVLWAQTPPPIWSGPYNGVTLGFGASDMETTTDTNRGKGREVSIFNGFNFIQGNRVFSLEGDLTVNIGADTVYGDRVVVGSTTAAVDWITTFRGRYGWANEHILYYATAGVAYSDTVSNGRSYDWGYVVGLGFEHRFTNVRWSFRGEALYHYFSPDNVTATRAELERSFVARLGLVRHY